MKIRNGFVSNSSSTSYTIGYKDGDPCPHCGRSDPDIVSLIAMYHDVDDETNIEHATTEDVLSFINNDIQEQQAELNALADKPDDQKINLFGNYHTTVGQQRELIASGVNGMISIRDDAMNAVSRGYKLADIDISYHDNVIRRLFDSMLTNGTIIVIDRRD